MRIERIIAIIILLFVRKRVSALYLAELFDVSKRTVYRDIDAINLAGLPIVSSTGPGGGFGIAEHYKIEKGLFSTEDIALLLSALNTLQPISLGQEMLTALEKVRSLVPESELERITTATQQVIVDYRPWFSTGNSLDTDTAEIKTAMAQKQLVAFTYTNLKGEQRVRRVEPYHLILKTGHWYLFGYCRLKEDFRLFKLTRMRSFKLLDEQFEAREFELSDYQKPPLPKQKLTVLIDPKVQQQLEESFLILSQYEHASKRLKVTIEFVEDDYSYAMLFWFGEAIEIIEPKEIRDRFIKRLKKIKKRYE